MQHNELPASLRAELAGEKPANALPDKWVRALFARLEIRYGDGWSRKWASIPDMALVHADWARQLAGTSGEAIAHALRHLPDDAPPTVGQFRALFARLEIRYGDGWSRKWASIPDMALVHADWARQLAGTSGEAIAHALRHLPDDAPPTVGQFRALCRRYVPESDLAQLEWTPQPLTGPVAEKVSDFMQAMRRKTRQAGGDAA